MGRTLTSGPGLGWPGRRAGWTCPREGHTGRACSHRPPRRLAATPSSPRWVWGSADQSDRVRQGQGAGHTQWRGRPGRLLGGDCHAGVLPCCCSAGPGWQQSCVWAQQSSGRCWGGAPKTEGVAGDKVGDSADRQVPSNGTGLKAHQPRRLDERPRMNVAAGS